jgi:hypothetical protein
MTNVLRLDYAPPMVRPSLVDLIPDHVTAKQVEDLAFALEQLPQIELPLEHTFADGLYLRQIRMPAGSFVIGKEHKTQHPNVIISGKVTVWSEKYGKQTFEGPCTWVTDAGVQKVLYMHTDVVWMTVHATTETSIPKLERMLGHEPPINGDAPAQKALVNMTAERVIRDVFSKEVSV